MLDQSEPVLSAEPALCCSEEMVWPSPTEHGGVHILLLTVGSVQWVQVGKCTSQLIDRLLFQQPCDGFEFPLKDHLLKKTKAVLVSYSWPTTGYIHRAATKAHLFCSVHRTSKQASEKQKGRGVKLKLKWLFHFNSIWTITKEILPWQSCICTHCCQTSSSETGRRGSQQCLLSAMRQTCNGSEVTFNVDLPSITGTMWGLQHQI